MLKKSVKEKCLHLSLKSIKIVLISTNYALVYLGKASKRCGAATVKALSPKVLKVFLP